MNIVWTTDVHVGNYGKNGGPEDGGINQRCQDTLDTLVWSVEYGNEVGAQAFFHLGDLFDYHRIEPQVVRAVQDILESANPYLLVGNHDQKSDAPHDHALAPLAPVAEIFEQGATWAEFGEDVAVLMVAFRSGRAEDWLPQAIADAFADRTPTQACVVLALHLGISDTKTPYYLDGADDSVCLGTLASIVQRFRFTHVFAGNWHNHRRWTLEGLGGTEVEIVQVGTLAPNRFTDTGGRFGTLAVLDTGTGDVKIVDVPGPRFVKLSGLGALTEFLAAPLDGRGFAPLYISVSVLPDEVAEAEEMLSEVKGKGVLRSFEIHIDRSAEDAQTQEAIAAACAAASHEDAVREYISAIPIEVPREKVAAFVHACLQEAKC